MFNKSGKGSDKSKVKSAATYIAGSALLCVAALIVIPKASPYISGTINKKIAKVNNAKKADDDWGPVIEKKNPDINDDEEDG